MDLLQSAGKDRNSGVTKGGRGGGHVPRAPTLGGRQNRQEKKIKQYITIRYLCVGLCLYMPTFAWVLICVSYVY